MIYGVLALFVIGLSLLIAEIAAPGFGLCGIASIISLMISAVLAILYVPYGLYVVIAEVCLTVLAGYSLFKFFKRKQLYSKLVLNETLDFDESPSGDVRFYIGKEGVSKTTLRPVGHVDFNGTVLEVVSEGAFIDKGAKVKVVDVTKQKVIVKQI